MAQFVDIVMPADSQEGTTATLTTWHKKVGDMVAEFDALAELETDKVNVEIPSPAKGRLTEVTKHPGDEVSPGEVMGRIQVDNLDQPTSPAPVVEATAPEGVAEPTAAIPSFGSEARLSPAVRRLLSEHRLHPTQIKGTGRDGRITKQDVLAFLDAGGSTAAPAAPAPAPAAKRAVPAAPAPMAAHLAPGGSRMVPHDKMRKSIASHMVASLLETAPHVTAMFEMDMGAVMKHRKANKAAFADSGVNLTFTAYFIMAVVEAVKVVPDVNSRWHEDALEIFNDVNVGIGTALGDKGLIVPVIRQAQNLGLRGVAAMLTEMTAKARDNKLSPADVQGGTITISNHGVSGSLVAAPIIINQPQSAILGIGKLQKRVMVVERDGEDCMQIRPMCYVTLTIDHRALDAFHCNAFLSRFVEVIESWPQN